MQSRLNRDLPFVNITTPFEIPRIKAGKLVMIKEKYVLPKLFYSDGRVAQTDVMFGDKQHGKNDEYLWQNYARKAFGHLDDKELSDNDWRRMEWAFADEIVRRGFLSQYVKTFGRDRNVLGEYANYIERPTLIRREAVIVFGVDTQYSCDAEVGLQGVYYGTTMSDKMMTMTVPHNPNDCRYQCDAGSVEKIIVGERAIDEFVRSQLTLKLKKMPL